METVVNVALPVFAIILAGWGAGKAGLLGQSASQALNAFVYWAALPPLLFRAMATTPVEDILHGSFIGAFLGGLMATWALAAVVGRIVHRDEAPILIMQGMSASFANTGYMGIPLFVAAFGQAGLPPASLATVIMSAIAVGIAVVALELTGSKDRGLGGALADVAGALIRNPLVMAPAAGVAWSAGGLSLAVPVDRLFELMGAAASPCALFAIGLFMASQQLRSDMAEVSWITVLKLFWQPLFTWALAVTLFPMDPFWTASAILLAALPTGALTFVVAGRYEVYVQRSSAVILVSTVVSVVTLSVLLAIYAPRFAPA
ncbi:MAG: AEC family transporter [Azospirillaceae bacterium]